MTKFAVIGAACLAAVLAAASPALAGGHGRGGHHGGGFHGGGFGACPGIVGGLIAGATVGAFGTRGPRLL